MTSKPRIVIIGLDGVPYDMIEYFARSGVMPNTAKLITEGFFTPINSSLPEVSSVAWSSMITGTNPGTHGIFGFIDMRPATYQMTFPNFSNLRAKPFWELWPGPSVIINVPSTYPVRPMDGAIISGFVSVDFNKSVYPASLIPVLQSFDYRLDVDSQKAHTSIDDFLADADKTIQTGIQAYEYLWQNQPWRTFMLVFTATDRLMHFLWHAYEDKNHKYHNVFIRHFETIDRTIGRLSSRLGDNDILVIHSDHGFQRLDCDVYINHFLHQQGLLTFKKNGEKILPNIDPATKAFALDPARIYINLKGKYPAGSVDAQQLPEVISALKTIFDRLEINSKKVIKTIFEKQQIYSGPCLADAPDLVLLAADGFNLKAATKSTALTDRGIFTGKHTYDTAFMLARGLKGDIPPHCPIAIHDIKGLIETSRTPQ